jgi:hypothetical protein
MNSILAFLFEIFSRLRSESPPFFKKLQWISGIILAICGALELLLSTHIWKPINAEDVSIILTKVIYAITTLFGTSFLAKKDSSLSDSNRLADGPGGTDPNKPHGKLP